MKVTVERTGAGQIQPPQNHPPQLDPHDRPSFPRRRMKAPGVGVRMRREAGAPPARRGSRPETPLLRWSPGVSARKLAAGLWRLNMLEFQIHTGQRVGGFQFGVDHFGGTLDCHHVDRVHGLTDNDMVHSPRSVHGHLFNKQWKELPSGTPTAGKPKKTTAQIFALPKAPGRHHSTAIPALEAELNRSLAHIDELESEHRSSKKKLEQFLRKLGEERAAWRSREHKKVRAIMDDIKSDLAHERKNPQQLEAVNSKLVNELADARLSAKRLAQGYDKERKARALIEDVCDELAKEIEEDKAEVEALKRECMSLDEEVEEERRVLQIAEVWREERVQMKLVDAKVMLEEKYSEMSGLVAGLMSLLSSGSGSEKIEEAEFLIQVAKSVSMQDVRELTYEPPNMVQFLDQLKASRMKEIAFKREAELEEIFAHAHIEIDTEVAREKILSLIDSGSIEPTELLADMENQIMKAKEEAASRKDILDKVEKWMSSCDEESWLEDYNRDENRYNASRGAHLNLKRAEKARILVSKIPALVDGLIAKTRAWEQDRGITFRYDGVPLLAMLDEYVILRHDREEEKKRLNEQKKFHEQLNKEHDSVLGSSPSPRHPSTKKAVGPRTNGAASRRLSLNAHQDGAKSVNRDGKMESRPVAPLNFVAISKEDAVETLSSAP
ncbi:65-kDa microtubule-associated protein 2 [Striga hermonthica]|uniref:65-kDa microtubule-associated protein 2 n=1 Tax=Striga hermonthica TaxID=68872 RepID=A0A9N7NG85_STRHE|nr:65-kDa microtubule-associated protein 2 [Striga hermonthica]